MTELFFIAFPVATIIFAIALEKIFHCPILVAAIIFAIFLIVTFAVFDATFLINTIIYTILAFITAFLVCLIGRGNFQNVNNYGNSCNTNAISVTSANLLNEASNNDCGCNNGCSSNFINCGCNRGYNMQITKCTRKFR